MVKRSAKAAPEWTGFQEARPYGPKYDLRTDFVMVYGISDDLPERIMRLEASRIYRTFDDGRGLGRLPGLFVR